MDLQRGFVLHRRPYSETSLLVDLFTEETGRLTVIAKGARAKRSAWKSVLQPFTPLFLRWSGKKRIKNTHESRARSNYAAFTANGFIQRVLCK